MLIIRLKLLKNNNQYDILYINCSLLQGFNKGKEKIYLFEIIIIITFVHVHFIKIKKRKN